MKEYTLKHETTSETVKIKAVTIDSDTHKYQWTFWGAIQHEHMIAIYSQRWNIIDIKEI